MMYVSDLYSQMLKDANLYGNKLIRIPTPRFLIFFNGIKEQPDEEILKLSVSYTVAEKHPSLELEAIMLNVNRGHNKKLMDACKTLRDYAEYTARVREYTETLCTEDAVERAITECIHEGILSEFLNKYRAEVKKVSIYEYDEEKHMRQEREQSKEDGREEGIKALIETCRELDVSREYTFTKIIEKFSFTPQKAEQYINDYWKE